jgi:hypothetical protein
MWVLHDYADRLADRRGLAGWRPHYSAGTNEGRHARTVLVGRAVMRRLQLPNQPDPLSIKPLYEVPG